MSMHWHRHGDQPVDTHVLLYHSKKRPEWLDQCLASLEHEPTNVLLVDFPAIPNVGLLRAMAHRRGTAPLLSFVDDDDWVMPGAFDACVTALEDKSLVGAYTDFTDVHCETGQVLRPYKKLPWTPRLQHTHLFEVLHVHVYRREPAMKYLDEMAKWTTLEESLLMGLLVQDGKWKKLDFDGYRKRYHTVGAGHRITNRMRIDLTQRLAPILVPEKFKRAPVTVADKIEAGIRRVVNSSAGCSSCKKTRAAIGGAMIGGLRRVAPRAR